MKKEKKWIIELIIYIVIIILITMVVPLFINESYKRGGYVTLWDASDVLAFYGAILSFLGTTVLGIIAIKQGSLANDLAKRMLEKEESENLPLIDIVQLDIDPEELKENELRNAYHLYINYSNFLFDSKNQLKESSDCVNVFQLRNTSNTNILSFRVLSAKQNTVFENDKVFETKVEQIETSLPISLAKADNCIICISGMVRHGPYELSADERFEQGYVNPQTELILEFELLNDKGNKYIEKIRIRCIDWLNSDQLDSPFLLEKDIIEIKRMEQ